MENKGYFVVDGSHLFASIYTIWRKKPKYKKKKLNIGKLTEALIRKWSINIGTAIRVVYYFRQKDKRLNTMLVIPETDRPGQKEHWQIRECGEGLSSVPQEELEKLSPEYRDHFIRSEKGLDIKLTCDALLLVARGVVSNIVFLVNDRDYIPLFQAIQDLGGNVYLTGLDGTQSIQKGLSNLADKYLTLDEELDNIFGVTKVISEVQKLQQVVEK